MRQGQLAPHTHYPPQLPPYSKSTAAALAECSGWLWLLVQHSCPFKDSVIVYRGLALLPQDPCPYKIPTHQGSVLTGAGNCSFSAYRGKGVGLDWEISLGLVYLIALQVFPGLGSVYCSLRTLA